MKRLGTAAVLACALAATNAGANNLFADQTVQDTDFTQSGLGGLRGVGTGSIGVSGVSGTVTQAYLYWHGPTNSSDTGVNATISFAGTSITGTQIGFSDDNFWGFENSQAWRADVTSLVSGNGSYALADMVKPGQAEINGASLIVFFDDGDDTNNRDIVLFHGNDANFSNPFDANGWNTTLSGINYTDGTGAIHLHVSDGQNFGSADDGTLLVNGSAIATGGLFQGDSTPASTGGVANGELWDLKSFDVTSFLSPGDNTLNIQMAAVSDALSLVVVAIELPAGSAPIIPEPSTWALLAAGLAGVGVAARRRRG